MLMPAAFLLAIIGTANCLNLNLVMESAGEIITIITVITIITIIIIITIITIIIIITTTIIVIIILIQSG